METTTKQPKFRSPERAYKYAMNQTLKLNTINEALIAKNGYYSYCYARDILGHRFEIAENQISKSCYYASDYACYALRGRFVLGERSIAESNDYYVIYNYVSKIFKRNVPTDFLQLCSIKILEKLSRDALNTEDIIKALFKKKILDNE